MKFPNKGRKVNARTIANMKAGQVERLLVRNGTLVEYESGYVVESEEVFSAYQPDEVSRYLRTECKTGLYAIILRYGACLVVKKMIHTATKKEAWDVCSFANWFYNCKTGEAYQNFPDGDFMEWFNGYYDRFADHG